MYLFVNIENTATRLGKAIGESYAKDWLKNCDTWGPNFSWEDATFPGTFAVIEWVKLYGEDPDTEKIVYDAAIDTWLKHNPNL